MSPSLVIAVTCRFFTCFFIVIFVLARHCLVNGIIFITNTIFVAWNQ
eukprot:COSAG02_NODE_36182_length_458_cov_0.660167_1_plen_46_part_10